MRVAIVAALVSVVAASDVIQLYHRVFHPNLPAQPYLERATVSLSGTLVPAPTLAEDLVSFSEVLQSLDDPTEVLYQVALGHEGDTSEAFWDFSSVKACYLGRILAETIVLHLSSEQYAAPFAVDYFVSPIPSDGSCPHTKSKKPLSASSSLKNFASKVQNLNSTILVQSPNTPPPPELRTPPPLTPEGQVVKPIPQKTFIQKYWMYIGALVLILLVGSGPEENEQQPRRGGGGR